MPKAAIAFLSVLVVALWVGPAEPAMTDKDKAELVTAVSDAKVTLEQGLATSKPREGEKKAKKDNLSYLSVSVWPEMKDHHSLATVTLVKGNDWKTAVIDLTVYKTLIKE